jgi:hypothetical protein
MVSKGDETCWAWMYFRIARVKMKFFNEATPELGLPCRVHANTYEVSMPSHDTSTPKKYRQHHESEDDAYFGRMQWKAPLRCPNHARFDHLCAGSTLLDRIGRQKLAPTMCQIRRLSHLLNWPCKRCTYHRLVELSFSRFGIRSKHLSTLITWPFARRRHHSIDYVAKKWSIRRFSALGFAGFGIWTLSNNKPIKAESSLSTSVPQRNASIVVEPSKRSTHTDSTQKSGNYRTNKPDHDMSGQQSPPPQTKVADEQQNKVRDLPEVA